MSMTPVANNGSNYQTADDLKWTWKQNYLYANSTTQRCPKEIIEKFSDWRFIPFATGVCEYLREFSNKFEIALMVSGVSGAWGKLIHEKNQKQKIAWHCPFKLTSLLKPRGLFWDLILVQPDGQVLHRAYHSLFTAAAHRGRFVHKNPHCSENPIYVFLFWE